MVIRKIIKSNVKLTCVWYMLDNWLSGLQLSMGNLSTTSGSRHANLGINESLDYIEKVHRDYLKYGKVDKLSGNIAEIGPGDNFGVALTMLSQGANSVHAVDRWEPQSSKDNMLSIYEALYKKEGYKKLFDGPPSENSIKNFYYHPGVAAEIFFKETNLKFDFILSRAVLEHLYDPLGALDSMINCLSPRGILIHRIDLRDHGMFSTHHPLTHFTINDKMWSLMTKNAGRPNRILSSDYDNWLKNSGLEGEILISRLVGYSKEIEPTSWDKIPSSLRLEAIKHVNSIREKLTGRYKKIDDNSLAISGCVLVARKS